MRVYRWDLDKTYLQTDFDSVRGLVRSAIEPARAKRAVPGATALIRELGREAPGWRARISIVSGSPTQMRAVLESKLRMDGIRWDSLILKDNLGNLKRARFRAVKDQFGYKLPELVEGRVGLGSAVRETLFGDDAEIDAIVYSVYADAIAGRIAPAELARILESARAYPDDVVRTLAALRRVAIGDAVDRIFIRLDRQSPVERFAPFGTRVIPVRSWFQAALVLYGSGEVSADGVGRVLATAMVPDTDVAPMVEDMLTRGAVSVDRVGALLDELGPAHAWRDVQPLLERPWAYLAPEPVVGVDWVKLLHAFRER